MATPPSDGLVIGEDRRKRCFWGASTPEYQRYHDEEWGRPVADDVRLFEKLCLEGFQAGLSWLTILRKRENFRAAFAGFDVAKIARFGVKDVTRLLGDAGIIRHRGKIESAINNAQRALELIESHGSIAGYLWQFEPTASSRPKAITWPALRTMTTNEASVALSKDLKKRGWTFVGPTTMYALMQAMGMVNDHLEGCHVQAAAGKARKQFSVPTVKAGAAAVVTVAAGMGKAKKPAAAKAKATKAAKPAKAPPATKAKKPRKK